MSLCWNDGITPWYPRTRYTMTNSGNKWPTNATLISAVIIEPPILTLVSATISSISLSWTNNPVPGLPISSYNIYQNFKLVANVLHPNNTITINDLEPGLIYVFYVTAVSNTYPIKTESRPSNTVSNTAIYFVVTGNPIQQVEGNQYTVAFTQDGTITFINPYKICTIVTPKGHLYWNTTKLHDYTFYDHIIYFGWAFLIVLPLILFWNKNNLPIFILLIMPLFAFIYGLYTDGKPSIWCYYTSYASIIAILLLALKQLNIFDVMNAFPNTAFHGPFKIKYFK
jgi:hypothetical protein